MNKKGFTLIEVIIALAIASIILIGFFKIINTTIKINSKNEKDIKSLNVAQAEVESLRAQIKNDDSIIKIKVDEDVNREIVTIDTNSSWIKSDKGVEILKINEKQYQGEDSNGNKDDSLLRYKRVLEEDKKIYIVTLNISREMITNNQVYNQYLYDINIKVEYDNKNISRKNTIVSTKVLGTS